MWFLEWFWSAPYLFFGPIAMLASIALVWEYLAGRKTRT
jgi:hypothetical protein